MSVRPIKKLLQTTPTVEGAGVKLQRAFGFGETTEFDPFLLFDDFRNDKPADYIAGFPWHPHRGIETITYVLPAQSFGAALTAPPVTDAEPQGNASVHVPAGARVRTFLVSDEGSLPAVLYQIPVVSRATATVGFDGRCKGGGVGEFWAKFVRARETVRIRNGRFSARLTGTTQNVGSVRGRDGTFHWRLKGRFLDRDTATATVSGKAELRMGRHVVSRCKIARAGTVRLTLGG